MLEKKQEFCLLVSENRFNVTHLYIIPSVKLQFEKVNYEKLYLSSQYREESMHSRTEIEV